MPFRDPSLSLRDISEAIDLIERFTHGMDFESYRDDPKTIAAVERKLLLISEAAIRGRHFVLACRGTTFAVSATGSGTNTIGLMLKQCGAR